MIRYRLTLTKEKDDVIDKDFTMTAVYALSDETELNLDPEYAIAEYLTERMLNHLLNAKDRGYLPWN